MNKRELVRLHKRLCKELGIKPARVLFRGRCQQYPDGCGVYNTGRNSMVLYMETIDGSGWDPRIVVAHETYHHFQHKMGWLGEDLRWKGRSKHYYSHRSYRTTPWEAGAFRYQAKVAKREGWV